MTDIFIFFIFFLVSRYLGRDTIHVSPAYRDASWASMYRYELNDETARLFQSLYFSRYWESTTGYINRHQLEKTNLVIGYLTKDTGNVE